MLDTYKRVFAETVLYLGMCGVMLAVMGTSVTARMKPREKLMRAVQPNNAAR